MWLNEEVIFMFKKSNNRGLFYFHFYESTRKIGIFLSIFILLLGSVLPSIGVIFAKTENDGNESFLLENMESTEREDIKIIREDISKRSESTKHFVKSDGSYEMVMYGERIHYFDGRQYEEIDNTLIEENNRIVNKCNDLKVNFPKILDETQDITLSYKDAKIKYTIENINSTKSSIENKQIVSESIYEINQNINKIKYKNIFKSTNLIYQILNNGIKEDIVLLKYVKNFSMSFLFSFENLDVTKDSSGLQIITNDDRKFIFEPLYMYGDDGDISYDIKQEWVEVEKNIYRLLIEPNDEFLQKAKYPLVIDPSLTLETENLVHDTFVDSRMPNNNFAHGQVMNLTESSNQICRGLINFKLPEELKKQVVTYAKLELKRNNNVAFENNIIRVYENTQLFSAYDVKWNTRPSYGDNLDYQKIDNKVTMTFDVTKAIKKWHNTILGDIEIPGFTLTSTGNNNETVSFYQHGFNRIGPKIIIGYETPAGIKNYWTYTTQDIGIAGKGLITDYTGNLTFIRNDFSINSLSLDFYYSNYTKNNNNGYGYGWLPNYDIKISTTSSGKQIIYPDGKKEEYVWHSSSTSNYASITVYKSLNNPASVLTYINAAGGYYSIELTTDLSPTLFFNSSGYLIRIEDIKTSNKIEVTRDANNNNRITSINDKFDNKIDFYWSGNQLFKSELKLKNGNSHNIVEEKNYQYSSDKLLEVSATYKYENNQTSSTKNICYTYNQDNSLLSASNDMNQKKVTYDYANNKVFDVVLTINDLNVGTYSISYGNNKTIYQDYLGEEAIYYFDNFGHTINIFDNDGNILGRKYDTNHNIIEDYTVYKRTVNKIENHGFEYEFGWTYSSNNVETCDESLYGIRGLKISKTNSYNEYASQTINLSTGYYTLEGYIKSNGGTGSMEVTGGAVTLNNPSPVTSGNWTKFVYQFRVDCTIDVAIVLKNTTIGTSYFDNIQIYEGFVNTEYNMLTDSSFENDGEEWELNGNGTCEINGPDYLGKKAAYIDGSPLTIKTISQSFQIGEDEVTTFSVGGYAKANASASQSLYLNGEPMTSEGMFGIIVETKYWSESFNSFRTEKEYIPFNPNITDWQFQGKTFCYDNIHKLTITLVYRGDGRAYFDDIRLHKESMGNQYGYNNKNQLVTFFGSWGHKIICRDDNGNIVEIETQKGADVDVTEYQYENNRLVETSKQGNYLPGETYNIKELFTYNQFGNLTLSKIEGRDSSNNLKWFSQSTTYTTDNQFVESVKDEFGNQTSYQYENGLLKTITDSLGLTTTYTHNNYGQITSVTESKGSESQTNNIVYDQHGKLIKLVQDNLVYQYEYNSLNQVIKVTVDNQVIIENEYVIKENANESFYTGMIKKQQYQNGTTIHFNYNDENQLIQIKIGNNVYYEYEYDHKGNLAVYKDIINSNIYFYSYNEDGKLLQIIDQSNNKINFTYDSLGNVDKISYDLGSNKRSVNYHYHQTTGEYNYTIYEVGSNNVIVDYDHNDPLRRLKEIVLTYNQLNITKKIVYDDTEVDIEMGNTTNRIFSEQIIISYNGVKDNETHTYTYDAGHNIKSIEIKDGNGNVIKRKTYTYDYFNRLISENIFSYGTYSTYVMYGYTYDNRSNIIRKNKYLPGAYFLPELDSHELYTYNNKNQLLTRVFYQQNNLKETWNYEYDSIGNIISETPVNEPVSYQYIWEGNKLKQVIIPQVDDGYYYKYNDEGIRVYKNVFGTHYYYTILGDKVLKETWSNNTILYTYDVDGSLISFNYNDTEYFYVKNMLNDIIKITDSNGNVLVTYDYDAYGNIIKTTDTSGINLSNINPYRYRSYRYDTETGYYYLNQRYYDPTTARFISQDDTGFLNPSDSRGMNLYAYCMNNPVMYVDPSGEIAICTILAAMAIGFGAGFVIGGSFEIGKQIYNNGWHPSTWDWGQIGLSALGGGVAGAISAIPIGGGGFISYLGTFFIGGIASVAGGLISGSVNSWESMAIAFGIGAVTNVFARGVSDIAKHFKVKKQINAIYPRASKIANMSSKKKSLEIWNLIGLDNFSRNAYKSWGVDQIYNLLIIEANNQISISATNNLLRYTIYSSIVSSLISGWY